MKKQPKIILASDLTSLFKYGYELTGIPKDDMRIGYVITAALASSDISWFEEVKKKIIAAGYNFEEIDIAGKTREQILEFFKDKNIVHVEGGNTFYLLKVIRETGFAEILKQLLNSGMVYIGTSAGSYVMCPTIEVSGWKVGRNQFGLTDLTALNYVPFVLKAHYTDGAEAESVTEENLKALKHPLRILRDGELIMLDESGTRFFGDNPETVI